MAFSSSARAAAATWDGSVSANWADTSGTDTNFTGGAGTNGILASGDSLTFTSATGVGGTTLNNNLTSAAFNIASITFNAGSPAYTINGNAFTLLNATAAIANLSSNNQTFGTPITVGYNGIGSRDHGINGGGQTLTFNGGFAYGANNLNAVTTASTIILNGAGTGAGTAAAIFGLSSTNNTLTSFTFRTDIANSIVQLGDKAALGTGAFYNQVDTTVRAGAALTGANAVGNAFVVGAGILTLGGSNALELSGSASLTGTGAAGAIINTGGNRTLSITNTAATTISGKVSLSDLSTTGRTLTVNVASGAGTTTISGPIVDFVGVNGSGTGGTAGSLTVNSGTTGALTLSGTNTYSGGTTLSGGTLNIGSDSALGAGTLTLTGGTLQNASGSLRTLGNAVTVNAADRAISSGTGGFTFNGGFAFGTNNLVLNTAAGTTTFNAAGTGSGFLASGGIFSLTTANNTNVRFALRNDIAGSVVQLGNAAALGTGALYANTNTTVQSNTSLTGASAVGNALIIGNANLTIGGSNNIEFSGASTAAGSGAAGSAGAVIASSNNSNRNLFITNTGTTTISGKVSINDNATATGRSLTVDVANTAGTTTISGPIVDYVGANGSGTGGVAGSLIKANSGALTLSGTNTYSGGTTLSGGTLNIGSDSALGAGTLTLTGGTLQNASGSLRTLGNAVTVNAADRAISSGTGGFTFNGGFAFGTNNLVLNTAAGTTTFNAAGTGSGFLASGGIFSLTTANNTNVRFALRNDIAGSVVQLGNAAALGTGALYANTNTTVQSNTSLTGASAVGNALIIGNANLTIGGSNNIEFSGASTAAGSGAAGSAGAVIASSNNSNRNLFITNTGTTTISGKVSINDNATATGRSLTVDVANTAGTTTISGPIVDYVGANGSGTGGVAGSLIKANSGALTLSGTNTYTGTTTVNAGKLLVNGSTAGGAVAVNVGTLGGTGTVGGAVTVANGATLLGGNGTTAVGALTLSSTPTLLSGSILELVLGASDAHSSLNLPTGFNGFNNNQAFTLDNIQTGSYDNIITGVASSITTSGWTVTNGSGFNYTFSDDGANIDLTVTAVPEPATVFGGLLVVGALCWRQLRQLRSMVLRVRRKLII